MSPGSLTARARPQAGPGTRAANLLIWHLPNALAGWTVVVTQSKGKRRQLSQARTQRPGGIGYLVQSDSDTLNPHELPFAGMLDRHQRSASGRSGCSVSPFLLDGLLSVVPQ